MLDIPLLLAAVSDHSSCGDDLEYDADFLQLERDAQGKPARMMGDAIHPEELPQWRHVAQSATALLQRSKDLRITHFMLQSALALEGFHGLASALTLVHDLLGRYWPIIHPRLDAEDDNDPTARINALTAIACETNLRLLRESELTNSRAFGPISLRAALHASGLQTFSDETLKSEELCGALRDSDPEHLNALRSTLRQAHSTVDAIEHYVSEQVGGAHGVDLSALKGLLKQALHILVEHAPDASVGEMNPDRVSPSCDETPPGPATESRPDAEISGREDVVRSLDRILDYYARHEPSSPLPVLLSRAKTLVHADFAAIVRNLIPDGFSQLEHLQGPDAH